MACGPDTAVGELAFHPHLGELELQVIANANIQLGHREDAAFGNACGLRERRADIDV